jgi:hypothetical protein
MRNALNSITGSFPIFRVGDPTNGHRSISAQLSGLLDGETRYIYHHLRSGSILSVKTLQPQLFEVFFGSHRLGRLNPLMSKQLSDLVKVGCQYRLTIGSIIREKYLPPSAIELELEWVEERLENVA